MKDLFITLLLFGWMPFVLFKPHMGVLLWSWVSHMNPHREASGFARDFNFLDFIALLTVAGYVMAKEKRSIPWHPVLVLMLLYLLWTVLTSSTGLSFDISQKKLTHLVKVMLFAFMSVLIIQSPNRLKAYVGVMVVSLLYIGVTGGLFTIVTGGSARVQGAGGMMGDNNALATAMAMLVPLVFYYIQHPPMKILRLPAVGAFALTAFAVLGTQSRGGFAALAVVGFTLLMKAKRRFLILLLMIPAAYGTYQFMPDSYKARIASSENATEDESFRGRLVMWRYATNVVEDYPVLGGGFDVFFIPRAQELYTPPNESARAVHSVYFEVLGEHGYGGLVLFMTMVFTAWFSASTVYSRYKRYQETLWIADLMNATRIGIMGYCVGGLTLNIATFDLLYHMMALVIMATFIVEKMAENGALTPIKPGDRQPLKAKPKFTPIKQPGIGARQNPSRNPDDLGAVGQAQATDSKPVWPT